MEDISVIIPTWNRQDTIKNAVESVVSQTYKVKEILVCDDGSTDDTFNIIKSLQLKYPQIIWLPGSRGGRPAIPRNRGLDIATGNWIAFLDSDDAWLPFKLEKQLNAIKNDGTLASSTNALRVNDKQESLGKLLPADKTIISFEDLCLINKIVCSSVLLHKSLLRYANTFPERKSLKAIEDYAFWLRIATLTSFSYLNNPYVIYRDEPSQSVRSDDVGFYRQRIRIFSDYLGWVKEVSSKNDIIASKAPLVRKLKYISFIKELTFGFLYGVLRKLRRKHI